jgi:hypothetical protein
MRSFPCLYASFAALAIFGIATTAPAQTLVETSSETRFQLDLKVPDAALKTFLPEGFTSNVAAQGPAKDCNLRLIFIDRITINGPMASRSARVRTASSTWPRR